MIETILPACDEKKIIAIDSFAKILSAAVSNGENIYYVEADTGMKHSELVMDYIDTLIKKASLTQREIQGVLCMSGPGSFTGLRIGYSIAKGLALSLSIPFAAIPTLDCIAYQITRTFGSENREQITESDERQTRLPTPNSQLPLILAIIEARKNSYFYAFFNNGSRLTQDKEGDTEQITEEINQFYKTAHKIAEAEASCENLPFNEKIVLTGPASLQFYESLPLKLKENVLTVYEGKGYACELIHLAKENKIFDNECSAFLFNGPEYIRVSDAEAALSKESGFIK